MFSMYYSILWICIIIYISYVHIMYSITYYLEIISCNYQWKVFRTVSFDRKHEMKIMSGVIT